MRPPLAPTTAASGMPQTGGPAVASGASPPVAATTTRAKPARTAAYPRFTLPPAKAESTVTARGAVHVALLILSFLAMFIGLFLEVGSITSTSWDNTIRFKGSMSMWTACLSFDQDCVQEPCLAQRYCLDPAWLTCDTAANVMYAARIIMIIAIVKFTVGLIIAGFDALGRFPRKLLCLSDRGFFAFMGLVRALLIGVSGALATSTWTADYCGQRTIEISGTALSGLPFALLASFIINFVALIAVVVMRSPGAETKKARIAAAAAAQNSGGQGGRPAATRGDGRVDDEVEMGSVPVPAARSAPAASRSAAPGGVAPSSAPAAAAAAADDSDDEVASTLARARRPLATTASAATA